MKRLFQSIPRSGDPPGKRSPKKKGSILLLSAGAMVMIMGFAAFTIDIGFITLTKTQMQSAADAAALAAGMEMLPGFGLGRERTIAETVANGELAATQVAAAHRSGDRDSCYLNRSRDVRYGVRTWDAVTGRWTETWGVPDKTGYNLVEVTIHRDQHYGSTTGDGGTAPGDSALPLFFGPVIGHTHAELMTTAVATFSPGVGFRIPPNSSMTAKILPITLDKITWDQLMGGAITDDNFAYNPDTGAIVPGQSDGICEVNLYPNGSNLPPGNRGTVDLGASNNSTSELSRQILYGLNASDLAYYGGELRFDNGPLYINGDTGLSAGIKDELTTIKGEPRAIPIFTEVHGPGNNATYTIVTFVGIRILDVKLTGSPSKKRVIVQPCPFSDPTVIRGEDTVVAPDSILAPLQLLR